MTDTLTEKQQMIVDMLRQSGPLTPTQIGMQAGKPYAAASSWACQGINPLVKRGVVARETDCGLVKYRYIAEGLRHD